MLYSITISYSECLPTSLIICKYYLGTHTIVVFFWGETRRKFIELGYGGWAMSVLCLLHSPSGFFGVALCWNNKGNWCLKEVSARSFLVIGKISVIITILIWCWPRNHDCLLYYTSMQRHLTSDCGWPASSCHSSYCIWTMMCLHTNLQVSVCIL